MTFLGWGQRFNFPSVLWAWHHPSSTAGPLMEGALMPLSWLFDASTRWRRYQIHVTNLLFSYLCTASAAQCYLCAVSGAETKRKSYRAGKENSVRLGQFLYSSYKFCDIFCSVFVMAALYFWPVVCSVFYFMAALHSRCGHCPVVSSSSSSIFIFFPRLISAIAD